MHTYFAIVADRRSFVQASCLYGQITDLTYLDDQIVTFSHADETTLDAMACFIKRGRIYAEKDIKPFLTGATLIGAPDDKQGGYLKKHYSIKRYKLVPTTHTDADVRDKGLECIRLYSDAGVAYRGIVSGYQNIALYEKIDFGKPVSGMEIGMMPSKLAHQMVNMGVGLVEIEKRKNPDTVTVWDPLCGFGTTNFVAHALGYSTIGTDINITQAKSNLRRWMAQTTDTGKCSMIKHDITQSCLANKILYNADCIVSEGWLGTVVGPKTKLPHVQATANDVVTLYTAMCGIITELVIATGKSMPICLTIPVYLKYDIYPSALILPIWQAAGRDVTILPDTYSRPKQMVGRQIMVGKFVGTTSS